MCCDLLSVSECVDFFFVISSVRSCLVCCLWWFWRDIDAANESVSMTILSFRAAFFSISFKASLIATSSAVIMLLWFVTFLFILISKSLLYIPIPTAFSFLDPSV